MHETNLQSVESKPLGPPVLTGARQSPCPRPPHTECQAALRPRWLALELSVSALGRPAPWLLLMSGEFMTVTGERHFEESMIIF